MKRRLYRVVCALALALILSACGGGGGSNEVTAPVTTDSPSVAAKTSTLPSGDIDCTYGGILVETGIDANNNSLLDTAEVSTTQKVCNGAPGETGQQGAGGADGLNALVKLTLEAPGTNCLSGGVRIDSGMDTSKSGILDANEITTTIYTCNGVDGLTGPTGLSGDGFTWVDVTATSQQAAANTGYLANSASQVTITLPPSSELALGDTVRVTGIGTGGWKIAQNPGQSIMTNKDFAVVWTPRGPIDKNWTSIASSSDGTKLVATASNDYIYTSTDSGATWTPRDSVRSWTSVASSSDGTKLVATASDDYIYTSTDSGATWTPRDSVRSWISVASSSDGTKLVATVMGMVFIYTSTDSGVTWALHGTPLYSLGVVASSSDGTRLVATSWPAYPSFTSNGLYTSTDSGATWTSRGPVGKYFNSVASSSDGTKLIATSSSEGLYTSTDSGATWTPRGSADKFFESVACSSDGVKLIATKIEYGVSSQIFTSSDSGVTWSQRFNLNTQAISALSHSVASSADGTKLVAGGRLGLYTYQGTFNMAGGAYDAIELQYVGNNRFTILSSAGDLVVQ